MIHKDNEKKLADHKAGESIFIDQNLVLSGDIYLRIVHVSKKSGEKLICRFGFHTSFLTSNDNEIQANFDLYTVDPNELKKKHA